MNAVGRVISAPLQAIGLIPKTPKLPAPVPQVTTDQAQIAAQDDDALAKRRGGAADIITGAQGAEATQPTAKATLGS